MIPVLVAVFVPLLVLGLLVASDWLESLIDVDIEPAPEPVVPAGR